MLQLREALKSDLESMTSVLLASFPYDPQWPYRFKYAAQYPQEHKFHTYQRLSDYLDDAAKGVSKTLVIEASSDDDPKSFKVIAFATYNLPGHLRKPRMPD